MRLLPPPEEIIFKTVIKRILQVSASLVCLCVLVYAGSCLYVNVKALDSNPFKVPDIEKATYSVKVVNTGLKYFTNKVSDDGNIVVMHGYWQLKGEKYKYSKLDSPPLDRKIFGPIEVRLRRG